MPISDSKHFHLLIRKVARIGLVNWRQSTFSEKTYYWLFFPILEHTLDSPIFRAELSNCFVWFSVQKPQFDIFIAVYTSQ